MTYHTGLGDGIRSEPYANWIWLVEISQRDVAVELVTEESVLASGLRRWFTTVSQVRHNSDTDGILEAMGGGSTDCIAAFVPGRAFVARRNEPSALLRRCHHVLKPNGILYLTDWNAEWLGARKLAHRALVPYGATAAAFAAAGFRVVRRYHVEPSPRFPRVIIPAARKSVAVREQLRSGSWIRRRTRQFLAEMGAHSRLYPAMAIIALK